MFGVSMVENGTGQFGDGALKLTLSEEWTDGRNWFFACWYKLRKAKSWFNDVCVGVVKKWPRLFISWDPKICCILRMNLWIELIFSMLMWDNNFWLDGYSTLWFLGVHCSCTSCYHYFCKHMIRLSTGETSGRLSKHQNLSEVLTSRNWQSWWPLDETFRQSQALLRQLVTLDRP